MRNKFRLILFFAIYLFSPLFLIAQNSLYGEVYNMSNTPAFATAGTQNFRGIAINRKGEIWLGTAASGTTGFGVFVRDSLWRQLPSTVNQQVRTVTSDNKFIWIGMGKTAVQAITGGAYLFYDKNNYVRWSSYAFNSNNGLPSRYLNSIAYDDINNRIWCAAGQDVTGGVTGEGGIAYLNGRTGVFTEITAGLPSTDIRALSISVGRNGIIAGIDKSCNGVCQSAKVIEYDLDGNDMNERDCSSLPRAVFIDSRGRTWVGMTDSIYVKVGPNNWITLKSPQIPFPSGAFVNFNCIKEDSDGSIFIGTTGGLLKCNPMNLQDPTNWALYKINDTYTSVTGIAFDSTGNKWLSSTSGVYKIPNNCKFTVHSRNIQNNKEYRFSYGKPIYISADGDDRSTKISFKTPTPFISLRVKGAEDVINKGKIVNINTSYLLSSDSIIAVYKHPEKLNTSEFSKEVILEAFNPLTGTVFDTLKLEIVRPPVIMFHGLWGDKEMWNDLMGSLKGSGHYKDFQLLKVGYDGAASFANNVSVFSDNFSWLTMTGSFVNFSFGKVDVIGHSMGGIIERLHLQSGYFKKDINKLITVNTPHSGSPLPNFVLRNESSKLRQILQAFNRDPYGGALENLKLNGTAINELNGRNLNRNIVPSHAIYSIQTPPELPNDWKGWLGLFILNFSTSMRFSSLPQACNSLFENGESDLVVNTLSQKGGLGTISGINDKNHLDNPNSLAFVITALALLEGDRNDAQVFSQSGFHPANILPNPLYSRSSQNNVVSNSTLTIINVPPGLSVLPNQIIPIHVQGSADVTNIGIYLGDKKDNLNTYYCLGNDTVVNYTIPMNATDTIKIFALGIDVNNVEVIDSTYIIVSQNSTLVGIKVIPADILVGIDKFAPINIIGIFSDGVERNISSDPNLQLNVSTASVAYLNSDKTKMFGSSVGSSLFTVQLNSFTTQGYVEVIDSSLSLYPDLNSLPHLFLEGFPIKSTDINICPTVEKTTCFDLFADSPITITQIEAPMHGTVLVDTTATTLCVKFIPANFAGNDIFKFKMCDANGNCDTIIIHYNLKQPFNGFPININGDTLLSSTYGSTYQWFYNNAPLPNDSLVGIVATNPGIYNVIINDYDGCPGTSANFINSPVPVRLGELQLQENKNHNLLSWKTYEEQNVQSYIIEYSKNGANFINLNSLIPLNSFMDERYSYKDFYHLVGSSFYRIKLTSINGEQKYSNIVHCKREKNYVIILRPNPVTSVLNLNINSETKGLLEVNVLDNAGKLIIKQTYPVSAGVSNLTIPVGKIPSGSYILSTFLNDQRSTIPFIKR